MLVAGWMVAGAAVALAERPGPGWAVGVLVVGAALLVLGLSAAMPRPKQPASLARPAAVDVETRRIQALQQRINEKAIEEREHRGT
jgi:hypothetical protein